MAADDASAGHPPELEAHLAAVETRLSALGNALRAATVAPAALLGITASVGTIEVGKLANLVVVSGNDLFASGTPIKHVFVEGRLY